ncbi:HAD-IIB family hydrolase [Collinsella sp. SGI.180]|uniref:HAD-IIB family hydrolase n=1 Tax=unclassified Collinsella TaxID=2637548 RepID=UPI00284E82B8|nr:HAD-IIB family hydrolase [Collinsella sp.]MDD7203721.1 HAD-IIB family hydrolase [Coriobacteriaceae bacterium]MCI6148356.1 HAD-IIB family hydrolase [Collinsella sp.]MCI6218672.1 HAD-IIB family hydrolase [Collinsella sp.]MCI6246919.1 HAD-IIB family hydrolase [Collinsella sp.]
MYRLVASDMDETFLDSNHAIPEANIRALKRMKELGVLFVPSSGRWYSSIMHNFAAVDASLLEGGYVLSYNGGFINRVGDPCPLTTCGLSRDCAEQLYQKGLELGLSMHINVADGHVFVPDADDDERAYLTSISGVTHISSADHPDLSFLDGRDIVKILFVNRNFDALQKLGGDLEPLAQRLGVEITFSSKRYLEFMPAGVNKGVGLMRLAEMLGIPMSEVIAVGDSANDLSMIQAAGLGVGVANVTDDVRPHCDGALETTGMDGAFEELVERYLEA